MVLHTQESLQFSQDIPKLIDEDCASDSSDEEKWDEIEEDAEVTKCLFSDKEFPSIEEAISHLKTAYKFDLAELKAKHSMDFYSYMKVSCCAICSYFNSNQSFCHFR